MGSRSGPTAAISLGAPPKPERADAARNRRHVLAATERLIAARGVEALTMDDIAAEAGVGKGTLYRRFGDKGGLAVALLNERERELQERIITGPSPLGPGADPAERLSTFVTAYAELVIAQLDLMLMSETSTPGARMLTGAHAFWRQHCTILLRQSGAPDPQFRAEILLATLSAEQIRYWTRNDAQDAGSLAEKLSAAALALASDR
ncbi:MAG: TetR/AcrR family transcriptional regulator [Cryobacterium sp.]|nr:TetR/AcrR family transcriptional regulator [Cryobacterium sp.]